MYAYQSFRKRYRNSRVFRKKIRCVVFLSLILFTVLTLFWIKSRTTKAAGNRIRVVSSIKIKEDDTLWGIASTYYSEEYADIQELIEEIQQINGIEDDHIESGNSIIVPHYIESPESP